MKGHKVATDVSQAVIKDYDTWHSSLEPEAYPNMPWHRLVRKYLDQERDVRDKRILEIGCGRGDFSCSLRQEYGGSRLFVAADFSMVAVRKGRSFSNAQDLAAISWETADIQAIPHADESFDTVISCETIEHVIEPRKALGEMYRVLRPGGRLFLTTPNYMGIMGLYRGYLRLSGRRFRESGQPINNFMLLPRTRAWVSSAGFKVKTVDATGQYLPFPRREPIELHFLNRPRNLVRWFALHSFVMAEK